ncbi:MAG: Stress response kinase A [Pseudomonas citronellolis]|nr:MAG: Stress response kinase A [Pseudomonas citronellolis]
MNAAPPRLAHGMGLEPVAADWPALCEADIEQLFARVPAAGALRALDWHSPRPFSAAALVRSTAGTLLVKRHARSVRTAAELNEEHAFIEHLRQRGIPVAALLRDAQGHSAFELDGWTYEVQRQAKGLDLYREALSWTPFQHLAHARAAGVALARLHRAAEGFGAGPRQARVLVSNLRSFGTADPLAAIERACAEDAALADYLEPRAWRAALAELHLPLHAELLPYLRQQAPLWTHNDWHASNLLWSAEGEQAEVSAVLDFGLADRSFALFDLATAIERNVIPWLELDQGGRAAADLDALDALLGGYASVLPLGRERRLALAALLPLVHADFALAEVSYFHGLLAAPHSAALAYDNYLFGHTRWFLGDEGQRLLGHLRQSAQRES